MSNFFKVAESLKNYYVKLHNNFYIVSIEILTPEGYVVQITKPKNEFLGKDYYHFKETYPTDSRDYESKVIVEDSPSDGYIGIYSKIVQLHAPYSVIREIVQNFRENLHNAEFTIGYMIGPYKIRLVVSTSEVAS